MPQQRPHTRIGPPEPGHATVGEKFLRVLSLVSRIPSVWLIVVSMLYGLAQLAFVDPGRFPSTDESIYIAEVSRFVDRIAWGPQRARGITLVVAPIVQLTAEMTPLRIYMVVVSSGALFGVFLIWCRLVWWASPLAAGLFASSWVVTYYGSEVMPNLYSALAAVGAVGMLLLYARSKSTGSAVGIVAFFAGMALFRPFDAAVVFAGVCAAWLIAGRPWPVRALMTAACGLVLGTAPWIVEAWIRFGGLGAGVDLATSSSPSLVGNITDYLLLLDGPLRPPDDAAGNCRRWAGLGGAAGSYVGRWTLNVDEARSSSNRCSVGSRNRPWAALFDRNRHRIPEVYAACFRPALRSLRHRNDRVHAKSRFPTRYVGVWRRVSGVGHMEPNGRSERRLRRWGTSSSNEGSWGGTSSQSFPRWGVLFPESACRSRNISGIRLPRGCSPRLG